MRRNDPPVRLAADRRAVAALAALVLAAVAAIMIGSPSTSAATSAQPQAQDPPLVENDFPVTVEGAFNDNRFTVFRPTDPQAVGTALPVLAFGNGACQHTSIDEVRQLLTTVASKGIVVVDTGSVDGSNNGVPSGQVMPELLTDAISFAEQEQERADSPLYQQLDLTKVATAGHSCGGLEAMVAAQDQRVAATVSVNSGFFEDGSLGGYTRDELNKLHTPVMFMDGGPSDIAYENSQANYQLTTVPAVMASHPDAGHGGFITGYQMNDAVTALVSFLDMVLNDNQTARDFILDPSGLGSQSPWTVANKNF